MEKKAVFITASDILNPYGNGGVKASREHLNLVKECFGDSNVFICMISENDMDTNVDRVKKIKKIEQKSGQLLSALFGYKNYYPWNEKEIVDYIDAILPDIVFIDFSTLGRLVKRLKRYKSYKTIVFFHNVESDYAMNKVKHEGIQYLPSYYASYKNDRCAIEADKVICLNERDSDRLFQLYGRKADMLLPITFIDTFEEEKTTSEYRKEILFLGSLFAPNQSAVEWFMENVMPRLDNVTLNIVGKDFEKKREEYKKYKNVNVIGSVEELEQYYYRHAVVVMPIVYGAGMKVKTAEAMMYGRIILASDEALEGYDIEGVKGIYRCNTAEEYIEKLTDIFTKNRLENYQQDVRNCFLEKYETTRQKQRLEKLICNII